MGIDITSADYRAWLRAFAEAWPDPAIVQQAVGQLPWGHNLVLLTRLKDSAYQLINAVPRKLQTSLPSIKQIETELSTDR